MADERSSHRARPSVSSSDDEEATASVERPAVGRVVLTGVAVGLAIGLIVFFLVAMPLYMIRAIDLAGDARSFVRNGVLRGAVPAGLVSAVIGGVAVGRWRWQGGRLAEPGRRDSPGVTEPGGR